MALVLPWTDWAEDSTFHSLLQLDSEEKLTTQNYIMRILFYYAIFLGPQAALKVPCRDDDSPMKTLW
jgi:hypothetical protein